MAQIFGKSSNSIARVSLAAVVFGFFGLWGVVYAIYRSPYTTDVNVPRAQEVPFSHQHHVSGLGIDCRDCHEAPERHLRPRDQIFNMKWEPAPDQAERGRQLIKEYHISTERLAELRDCGMCHR